MVDTILDNSSWFVDLFEDLLIQYEFVPKSDSKRCRARKLQTNK
jgi:hypothetical protein